MEQFRGSHGKRLELHPREKAVLWIVAVHVCALPWAIGAMRLWSQIPSFIVAVLGLIIALLPRSYTAEHTGMSAFKLLPWPKLLRFPLFWIGLALLGYFAVQTLNPSWEYHTDGNLWWMQKIENISWLPEGVRAPFERWGPWRVLMIYTTVWLTVCTVWIGITRRRTLQILFLAFACNGLALALFGLVQQTMGNGKLFWFWRSPNSSFFSSYVYKNHAAYYLNLSLAVTCGLTGWYYLRGLRRMEKSNPSGVFAFFATCIAVAVFMSFARGATIFMLGFLCVVSAVFVIHQLRAPAEHRKPLVVVGLCLAFGAFLFTGLHALDSDKAWLRLKRGVLEQDASLEARRTATSAAMDMLKDTWPTGTGAGSFRFLFTIFQQKYPEITYRASNRRMWWEHAHNDIVQFPIEYGLAGMVLLLSGIGWVLLTALKAYAWENPLSLCLLLGLLALLGSSWWDFPFQNPAILMLAAVLFITSAMWAKFEESNPRA